jgi:hypothetical protein
LPRRAPVGTSGPIRGRTLAIFATTDAAGLDRAVPRRGAARFPATVEPGGRPATAVADLSEAEAVDVARGLGLAEILFWDGRRAQVLPSR